MQRPIKNSVNLQIKKNSINHDEGVKNHFNETSGALSDSNSHNELNPPVKQEKLDQNELPVTFNCESKFEIKKASIFKTFKKLSILILSF